MKTIFISSIRSLGVKPTIDLEIDSSDHNFFCNDICVSNSHATSYGATCALSVYLKFKYPIEFYTVLLNSSKNEPAPFDEIAAIERELHYFGIKLLPPDILKSAADFVIEGADIRFGLGSIRGVSTQTIEKVLTFRGEEHPTKFAIFEGMKQGGINIGICAALVQSGALQSFGEARGRLVLEAQIYNVLTDRERVIVQKLAAESDDVVNVLKVMKTRLDEKGKVLLKESRLGTIKKKIAPYIGIYQQNSKNPRLANYYFERKYLGYSHSEKLIDLFIDKDPDLVNMAGLAKFQIDDLVHVVGLVQEVRQGISKKKKVRWARFHLVDETGSISVMIFSHSIDEAVEINGGVLPAEGSILYCRGQLKEGTIFASTVSVQDSLIAEKISQVKGVPE